jgi:hypothetical protein
VIFAYKNFMAMGFSHTGLGNSARMTANTLSRAGVWTDVWAITTVDDLCKRLSNVQYEAKSYHEHRVSHVVLHAPWLTVQAVGSLISRFPDVRFLQICHSKVSFLYVDTGAVSRLHDLVELSQTVPNYCFCGNSRKFSDWVTRTLGKSLYLPNLYDVSTFRSLSGRRTPSNTLLKVGCFGATRPFKNLITAAAATMELAEMLGVGAEFHISSGRDTSKQVLLTVAELLSPSRRVKLVDAGWQSWGKFRRLIGTMNVLMQPSFTESFNMVTADGIAEGVCSAVSEAIDWVPKRWRADSDNANDVAKVAANLLYDGYAVEEGREALLDYVKLGTRIWLDYLLGR